MLVSPGFYLFVCHFEPIRKAPPSLGCSVSPPVTRFLSRNLPWSHFPFMLLIISYFSSQITTQHVKLIATFPIFRCVYPTPHSLKWLCATQIYLKLNFLSCCTHNTAGIVENLSHITAVSFISPQKWCKLCSRNTEAHTFNPAATWSFTCFCCRNMHSSAYKINIIPSN